MQATMNKIELLSGYLDVLDSMTEATQTALKTLENNSKIVRSIIQELIDGTDNSELDLLSIKDSLELDNKDDEMKVIGSFDDDAETIANKVVEYIKKTDKKILDKGNSGIYGISIAYNPDKVNPEEIYKLIDKKLEDYNGNVTPMQNDSKRDDENEEFDFREFM